MGQIREIDCMILIKYIQRKATVNSFCYRRRKHSCSL